MDISMLYRNREQDFYKYNAFGLQIESEVEIPGFLQGEGKRDLTILYGTTPVKIEDALEVTENYQISKNEFLFYIKNVAHYYVKNGNLIIIDPDENNDYNSIKIYLVATAIGILLLQRGMIPIHGSSVVIDDHCVILTGECGSGKSTLCSAMRKIGYKFMADDISVVTLSGDGIPMVQPAFPQQRLCENTVKLMGYDISKLSLTCKDDDKYIVNAHESFINKPVPLSAIFELSPKNNCTVSISRVLGTEKLGSFMRNIYWVPMLSIIGCTPMCFKKCINIVHNISFYKMQRPIGRFFIDEQIKFITETLKYN
jgi:energy-coupling factor transporter ATP-binding protein EcfA2